MGNCHPAAGLTPSPHPHPVPGTLWYFTAALGRVTHTGQLGDRAWDGAGVSGSGGKGVELLTPCPRGPGGCADDQGLWAVRI